MGKAEECPGKDDGQSGRKGERQGSGGSKKMGSEGEGYQCPKAEFPCKEPRVTNSYEKVRDLLMKQLMSKVFGPCLSKITQKMRPKKSIFGTFSRSIRDWNNLEFSHSNI